jgi:Lon protease-like protein
MSRTTDTSTLSLFPLQAVLFPEGLLTLKVFEARYLDLISECLRNRTPFGVVTLRHGHEVRREGETVEFESTGCVAEVLDVDSSGPGLLKVRCRGAGRFSVRRSDQQANGLWVAEVSSIEADPAQLPGPELVECAKALANTIKMLKSKGPVPFLEPYRFEDAGWIANRWCEILPIPLAAKQKLMELPEPLVRLKLVDQFLRAKGII